jgi:peptidoglycan DL-endopeptidase CwlO
VSPARAQYRVVTRAARATQAQLADLARALYQQPDHDPLAILLGAASLEEALAALDGIDRAAEQSRRILEEAREAKARLAGARERLAAHAAELARATAAAEAQAAALAATSSSRRTLIAGLRRQQGLNAARVASIERQAREAEGRTAALTRAAPAPTAAPAAVDATAASGPTAPVAEIAPVVPAGPGTLTVASTGYALTGRTATGILTAPGVVAVDPSVIPLGTRMTIPGYGTGIAADTGGAIKGAKIDLWFPTVEQALAWGNRTVTITIH